MEILFRGKEVRKGEWVEGYYCPCVISGFPATPCIISKKNLDNGCWTPDRIIPESIGQFIGLTDKNGKKIFEGDIIACKNYDEELVVEGVVKYGNFNCSCCDGVYGWYIDGGDIRRLADWVDDSDAEVIGNIYDNPELVK